MRRRTSAPPSSSCRKGIAPGPCRPAASAGRTFGGATGIAGADAPFSATAAEFARRIVEAQGANAETAERFDHGQQVALAAIQSRFADYSGVNIDQEMAMLVQLQTAYGANARIMTAVRDMLDMLMRI